MIASPPDPGTTTTRRRRDFHQDFEYDKRWFGPFDKWPSKLTKVRSADTVSRNYHVCGHSHYSNAPCGSLIMMYGSSGQIHTQFSTQINNAPIFRPALTSVSLVLPRFRVNSDITLRRRLFLRQSNRPMSFLMQVQVLKRPLSLLEWQRRTTAAEGEN